MSPNQKKFQELLARGRIPVKRGPLFDLALLPKPPDFDFGGVEGMLLGVAIGDALGVTTEGLTASERRERFGELRDYIPNRYVSEPRGIPSDDTQLSFWTLEQMIEDRGFVPDHVADRFCRDRIFGIGSTVRRFLANRKAGLPWDCCGPESAGNGALMRIAPMLVPHLRLGGTALWADTALSAMMTHRDTASLAACLSFVAMLWELLDMPVPPPRRWWLERYVQLARELETEASYAPRGGEFLDYRGPLWAFVQQKVAWADAADLSVVDACRTWYSGAYLLETVPSVLYILMRHGHDLEEAIVRAVNDTKDNDTMAAIVGAAVGALHGRRAIPRRWVENLSGRTAGSDDGKVFELVARARAVFWDDFHPSPLSPESEPGEQVL